MRVALFATCLVDLMRPEVGIATLSLLEAAGCEVELPMLACCGQPAYNSGARDAARELAQRAVAALEGFDWVVLPSGSCGGMIRTHYPDLLDDDPVWRARLQALLPRVRELSEFLLQVARPAKLPLQPDPDAPATVTYHDSCSGLRELGIASGPRQLLQESGITVQEMENSRACCGFGGTFALKYGDISAAICDEKCAAACASGAQALVLGDTGCLLHIEGRLRRTGSSLPVLHYAQLLAGKTEA